MSEAEMCLWVKGRKCPHKGFPALLVIGKGVETELDALRMIGKLMICVNCLLGTMLMK